MIELSPKKCYAIKGIFKRMSLLYKNQVQNCNSENNIFKSLFL